MVPPYVNVESVYKVSLLLFLFILGEIPTVVYVVDKTGKFRDGSM